MPICVDCKQECKPVRTDIGIGRYEYWGARGNDVRLVWLSDCCEADIECEDGSDYEDDDCDDYPD